MDTIHRHDVILEFPTSPVDILFISLHNNKKLDAGDTFLDLKSLCQNVMQYATPPTWTTPNLPCVYTVCIIGGSEKSFPFVALIGHWLYPTTPTQTI